MLDSAARQSLGSLAARSRNSLQCTPMRVAGRAKKLVMLLAVLVGLNADPDVVTVRW